MGLAPSKSVAKEPTGLQKTPGPRQEKKQASGGSAPRNSSAPEITHTLLGSVPSDGENRGSEGYAQLSIFQGTRQQPKKLQ